MNNSGAIFFDVNLPNPATWFYFSALLAVALFFKFSRLLSMRNWDVLTLFLLMPGLLLLGDGPENKFWGYLALLGASGYFLVRCLVDLTLVRHLVIVAGLVLIGRRHFQDLHGGVAAATFYLLLPYTYLLMPSTPLGVGRWDHAWPMALMIWMVLAYRRPTVSGAFLGLA